MWWGVGGSGSVVSGRPWGVGEVSWGAPAARGLGGGGVDLIKKQTNADQR